MVKFLSKSLLLGLSLCSVLGACSKDEPEGVTPLDPQTTQGAEHATRLSSSQALAYAQLFGQEASNAGRPETLRSFTPKEISHISYSLDGRDTLLYAVNYKNDEGFILIAGDNSAFPIIAHGDKGSFDFEKIDKESPLYATLMSYRAKVRESLRNPKGSDSQYFQDWKDLGNKDYQYEIEPITSEPSSNEFRGGGETRV